LPGYRIPVSHQSAYLNASDPTLYVKLCRQLLSREFFLFNMRKKFFSINKYCMAAKWFKYRYSILFHSCSKKSNLVNTRFKIRIFCSFV
jgi:hypothetical protein